MYLYIQLYAESSGPNFLNSLDIVSHLSTSHSLNGAEVSSWPKVTIAGTKEHISEIMSNFIDLNNGSQIIWFLGVWKIRLLLGFWSMEYDMIYMYRVFIWDGLKLAPCRSIPSLHYPIDKTVGILYENNKNITASYHAISKQFDVYNDNK